MQALFEELTWPPTLATGVQASFGTSFCGRDELAQTGVADDVSRPLRGVAAGSDTPMCRVICEEATVRFRFQLVSWTTRRAYINGLTRTAAATVHGGSMCRSQL